jgi:hypothetical protein
MATYSYDYMYTIILWAHRRTAGTPVGGGQADTPAGAILLMDIYIYAYATGGGGYGGSPTWRQGRCISKLYFLWPPHDTAGTLRYYTTVLHFELQSRFPS